MKNFFKTRFFIAVLIIALAMIAVPSILTAMGLSDVVQSGIAAILMPGQKLFSFAADGLSGYAAYFTEYDRLAAENERLKSDLAKMNDKVYTAEELERMNDWLYDYLELKREHMDFSLTEAAVTGRGSSNYISVLTIDRGTSSGCLENMPVVTSDGIVGYIAEAGAHWAKVVTIAEASSATGAVISRTGETGLVSGSYSLAAAGLLKMTYLSPDSDVAVGDRIVASGYGSVYPRGLVIGYVDSVETDEFSQNKVAYVKLAANLGDLTNVMVITSYETKEATDADE